MSAKRARSDATMMSQLNASSSAPVTHTPLTAAITGFGHARTTAAGSVISSAVVASPAVPARISFRSTPPENAGSVPVRTTTSTVSSATRVGHHFLQADPDGTAGRVARLRSVEADRAHAVGVGDDQLLVEGRRQFRTGSIPRRELSQVRMRSSGTISIVSVGTS